MTWTTWKQKYRCRKLKCNLVLKLTKTCQMTNYLHTKKKIPPPQEQPVELRGNLPNVFFPEETTCPHFPGPRSTAVQHHNYSGNSLWLNIYWKRQVMLIVWKTCIYFRLSFFLPVCPSHTVHIKSLFVILWKSLFNVILIFFRHANNDELLPGALVLIFSYFSLKSDPITLFYDIIKCT